MLPLTGHDEEQARRLLGRFLFTADEVEKQVAVLSGGERSRLRLLRLLVGEANFLLLDEPTNHLDVTSVDALADGLDDYSGTLLLVTHDRHLIDRVAGRVLEIHDGRLLAHLSPQRYWEARAARTTPGDGGEAEAPASAGDGGARKGGAHGATPRPPPRRAPPRPASAAPRRRAGNEPACAPPRPPFSSSSAAWARSTRTLAEPETYADRDVLDRLLDERSRVEDELRREYEAWSRLVDEERLTLPASPPERKGGLTPSLDETRVAELQERLLTWYAANGRDLPWRRTTDPYAVLVSEVMLQQTQVPRVVPRFEEFLRAFPTLEALAGGPLADVLRGWRGLGYNNRAERLWRCAREAVARGPAGRPRQLPDTLEELRALPGVGPYTARAVMVFAHNADLAAVDANVRRVLSHELDLPTDLAPAALQAVADAVLPRGPQPRLAQRAHGLRLAGADGASHGHRAAHPPGRLRRLAPLVPVAAPAHSARRRAAGRSRTLARTSRGRGGLRRRPLPRARTRRPGAPRRRSGRPGLRAAPTGRQRRPEAPSLRVA